MTLLDGLPTTTEANDDRERVHAYWSAATAAAERGQRGEALQLIERASALSSKGADERHDTGVQVTKACILLSQEPPDPERARALLRDALPRLRQHAGPEVVAMVETDLARAELLLCRPGSARRHATEALTKLTGAHSLSAARAKAALGAALIAEGDAAGGARTLREAGATLAGSTPTRQAAAVWRDLCHAYRAVGDVDRAVEAMDRALDLFGVGEARPAANPPAANPTPWPA